MQKKFSKLFSMLVACSFAFMISSVQAQQANINDFMQSFDEIATAIESVSDETSARNAAQVIASATDKIKALSAQMSNDSSNANAYVQLYASPEFQAVQQRLAQGMGKLMSLDPKILQIISDEMNKLQQ